MNWAYVEPVSYPLIKFKRSNQDTCINYRPIVDVGERVNAGRCHCRRAGSARRRTGARLQRAGGIHAVARIQLRGRDHRQRAVGSATIFSRRFTLKNMNCKSETPSAELKKSPAKFRTSRKKSCRISTSIGIVKTGTEVEAGDVLVGKVTPKGETELSPEERLLRAIFGEKAADVRDASLKAPPGLKGIVIDTKIFSRKERSEEAKKREKGDVGGNQEETRRPDQADQGALAMSGWRQCLKVRPPRR